MTFKPTGQQETIRDAYITGDNMVIEAGAGSGKTSTLKLIAGATPERKGLYLAYNKAIQMDAERSFPRNTLCKTAHGLAYKTHANKDRLKGPRVTAREAARILGIEAERVADDAAPLAPAQIARIANETVQRYCYSADPEIGYHHVPRTNGYDDKPTHGNICKLVVPYARRIWADLCAKSGKLRYSHDCYLKSFCLDAPQLPFDVVFFDEAQDANGCVAGLVVAQKNTQLCLVGDRNQSIYAWRGAQDAMENFDGDRYFLTKSFRFGQAIADEANLWLDILGAPLRIEGYEAKHSTVGVQQLAEHDAVLCRTNARAVSEVMQAFERGRRPALVGGGKEIRRMAEAAEDLKAGRGTAHPELFAFDSWGMVQEYVQNEKDGSDLKVFVNLIDQYGPDVVINTMDRLYEENRADVTVSTAHKAKGREWRDVKVADDFKEPKATEEKPNPEVARESAMLAYVTVTRAMRHLDRDGLAWVSKFVKDALPAPVVAEPAKFDEVVSRATPGFALPARAGLVRHLDSTQPFGSTCICDAAAAKKSFELTKQPAGRDVPRCYRCGGGVPAAT